MIIYIVSFFLSILIVGFVYLLITPNTSTETFFLNKNTKIDPTMKRAINFMGGDIAALIPRSIKKRNRRNKKLERLFITSGNPWNLTQEEFLVTRIFLGLGGLVLSVLACVLVIYQLLGTFLSIAIVLFLTIGGFFYPKYLYKSESDDRMQDFKRELPEAIDYLLIAMSGGTYSLPSAMEKIIKYLPEGVIKGEFTHIIDDLNSGLTLEYALNSFAKRAPTEGIEAFVNSLNNASKLNAPIGEILKNRAEASRKELNAEIDKKIASLSTKVLVAFGPPSYLSILIVVIAPTASTLMEAFS